MQCHFFGSMWLQIRFALSIVLTGALDIIAYVVMWVRMVSQSKVVAVMHIKSYVVDHCFCNLRELYCN